MNRKTNMQKELILRKTNFAEFFIFRKIIKNCVAEFFAE